MTERRFNEAEVAAIFERATAAQQTTGQRALPSGEGLTLAQVQEIGREVGISSELVVQAAKALDQVGRPTSRQFLGFTIGVGRTIELDRKLSEAEWERLVVDLRETFDARGTVRADGSFRQWTNGNLQALLEPTETGQRLRLRTVKGDVQGMMVGGLAMLGGGAAALMATVLRGGAGDAGRLSAVAFLAAMGVGMFGIAALRLRPWARLRQQQMEAIADRVTLAVKSPDSPNER